MTHSFLSSAYRFIMLSAVGVFGLAAESNAITVQIIPSLPSPVESVKVGIAFESCIGYERWEKLSNRIIVYTRRSNFSLCPSGDVAEIVIGVLPAGQYTIEVFERSIDASSPPDGYTKTAEQRFSVASGRAIVGKPTKIVVVGSTSSVQDFRSSTVVTFSIRDSSGIAIPDVPLGFRTVSTGNAPIGVACDAYAFSVACPAYQTGGDGAITTAVPRTRDADSAQITTVIGTTTIDNRAQSAYATVGYIDVLRRDSVVTVVEYEIDASLTGLPSRYYLSADDATSLALDNTSLVFQRTYAAFFGVRPNTLGAVPVCRFFVNGKAGISLTHVFTADAADCAAKKADSRYADEGIAFWAYPATAIGGCPAATRGVTRYVLTRAANGGNASLRYSTLLSMKSRAALGGVGPDGVSVRNDGVAFCVPD